jgi:hypothetical protein
MALKLTNNATSTLAAAIDGSATSLLLKPGDGAKFPTLAAGDWCPIVCVKSDGTLEIMRCTARATDTLTVTRAQEGTGALSFSSGDRVELRMTVNGFNEFLHNGSTQASIPSLYFQLNGVTQWAINDDANGALSFDRYSAGAYVDSPLKISSAGALSFSGDSGNFTITGTGANGANIKLTGNGGATPSKSLRVLNGAFQVVNDTYTTALLAVDDSGNVTATGDITSNSDERLKAEWEPVQRGFIEQLAKVRSGTYMRLDIEKRQAGVGAQSLRNVLPEAVIEGERGTLSVAYGQAALVACVELAKEVMQLRSLLEPTK